VPEPASPSPFTRYAARAPNPGEKRDSPSGWVLFAAFGPCGFSPFAPGTAGTLGAVPLYMALSLLPWPAYLLVTAALLLLGIVAAGRAGRYWGVVDASPIVIDEVVGYLVTMALVPFSWPAAAAGFVLFRLFDIWKPWPVSALDRLKSGLGVMLDDVGAGVYGWVCLQLLLRLVHGLH
jgi:phosphatidylglycerophosphatase A